MATQTLSRRVQPARFRLRQAKWLGAILVLPAALFLLVFLAYPFVLGIYLGFTDARIGRPGEFIGFENYRYLLIDPVFRTAAVNAAVYTVSAVVLKTILGLSLAMLLNQPFRGYRFVRALTLIPWVVPSVLSAIAWWWIFDPQYSAISWLLRNGGLISENINFLGDRILARASLIYVNTWRGTPFFAIGFLAGLQTVPDSLVDAAKVDGANPWQVFWNITWPLLLPLTTILTTFSTLWTFADFQLVWAITRGGPANATHLFVTLAYQRAIQGSVLSEGAAVASFTLPVLIIVAGSAVWALRRQS
ncbi:MAG: sugar ABC transporter permease [Deinococcota bacterium]